MIAQALPWQEGQNNRWKKYQEENGTHAAPRATCTKCTQPKKLVCRMSHRRQTAFRTSEFGSKPRDCCTVQNSPSPLQQLSSPKMLKREAHNQLQGEMKADGQLQYRCQTILGIVGSVHSPSR